MFLLKMSLIEKFISLWLPEASSDFLTHLCTEYAIDIPAAKAGKQEELLKLVTRYLTSAELEATPDQGQAVFLKLFNELGAELGKGQPKQEPLDTTADGAVSTVLTYNKLRELKIHGTIDGGKKGTLNYTSLSCQLKQAEAAGYKTSEIVAAVIKACPAGSSFRSLLEAKVDIENEDFFKLLRSHFKEKDSSGVLQEMLNLYQLPGQDAHEFCCMAMALRDRIQVLSEEEGNPWQPASLTSRMYHTIFTGLKQNSIRMELNSELKAANKEDIDFLELIAKAEANEAERLDKVKVKPDVALLSEKTGSAANKIVSPSPSSTQKKAKSPPAAAASHQISENDSKFDLLCAKIDSLATSSSKLSDRVLQLEKNIADSASRPNSANSYASNPLGKHSVVRNRNGKIVYKCKNCVMDKVGYCNHCFKCLENGHKTQNCPN